MAEKVTVPLVQQMKRERRKIVALVVYDYQMAQLADRAGAEIVSAGDSVGVNVWGHRSELEVTLDEMVLVCRAVRRGVERALVSCDCPFGPLQQGIDAALAAAVRLVKDGGADIVKLDGASLFPAAVRAIAGAGIPVWAQFGMTPHTAFRYGGITDDAPERAAAMTATLVDEAKLLESAGASLLDFTNSGPVAGPEVVGAVGIPVVGGLGGGPWLDGRVRSLAAALGTLASSIGDGRDRYARLAETASAAIAELCDDIRSGRQLRGAPPVKLT